MKTTIAEIARITLGIETLEARNSDSLDFHEVAVWRVSAALERAFRAGQIGTQEAAQNTRDFAANKPDDNIMWAASTELLTRVARGEIDLNLLARMQLAARGMDQDGVWIGFDKAKALHGV